MTRRPTQTHVTPPDRRAEDPVEAGLRASHVPTYDRCGLVSADLNGRVSRNLLVHPKHADAWVFIDGPWAGLVFAPGHGQRGSREPLAPAAQPWAPEGQR